jgi:RHS repeat-associated protein
MKGTYHSTAASAINSSKVFRVKSALQAPGYKKYVGKVSASFKMTAVLIILSAVVFGQTSSTTYPTNSYTPSSLATGSPLGSYSISNIENVNLFSGNLNITLPLVQIGGRGAGGYTMSLPIEYRWRIQDAYYPSGTWGGGPPPPSAWAHHYYPQAGWWTKGAGFGPGVMRSRRSSTFQGVCPQTSETTVGGGQVLTQMTFSAPGGTEISFFDRRTGGTPTNYSPNWGCIENPDGANRGNVWVTGDGSNVVFITGSNIYETPGSNVGDIGYPSGDMYFPDGTHYRIDSGSVTYINDRNGNKISFTYSSTIDGDVTSITDPLNRTLTNIGTGTSTTKTITVPGVGGTNRTIEIGNDSIGNVLQTGYTLKGNNLLFPELGADVQNQTTPQSYTVVSYLKLPNNKQYNFKYDSHGDVARIELPTGGAIEYDWGGTATTGCGAKIKRWVTERRVYPGGGTGSTYESKTRYEYGTDTIDGVTVKKTTVTAYDGETPLSVSKHYFTPEEPGCSYESSNVSAFLPTGQYGREILTENYAANGTTLLNKVKKEFEFRTLTTTSFGNKQVDYRLLRETNTLADVSPNLISKREYGYDSNVDLTRETDVWDYDFGSGQVGSLKRHTHTDYVSTNPVNSINYLDNTIHLVNLVAQTWISSDSGGNNKLSLTKYEYDNYSTDSVHAQLTPRDDIIGHLRTDNANQFNTSYTSRGNVTKITKYIDAMNENSGAVSTAMQYDIAGNVVKTFDGNLNATTISYSDNFGVADSEARTNTAPTQLNGKKTYAFATSSSNPLQFTTYSQFDYHTGLKVNTEDINGVVGKQVYIDSLNRLTQMVTAVGTSLEQQATIAYDDTNRVVTATSDFNALNDNLLKAESLYDGLGRVYESRKYQSDGTFVATRNDFDALGRDYKTSNPFKQGTAESDLRWTKKEFDALGRVVKLVFPDDTPTNETDNSTVLTTYLGNARTITDQAGRKRTGISNAIGQMTRVIEDPDGQNLVTDYVFDAVDNIRKTTQGVQNRYFFYDSIGRIIRARQPEQSTNSSLNLTDPLTGNSQWSSSYTYDNNGNATNMVNARNVAITGTYDALNRLTFRDYSDSTPDVTFVYDTTTIYGTSVNFKSGLTKVITGNPQSPFSVSHNLTVDLLGRVRSSQQRTDNNVYDFPNYTYNLMGLLTSQMYPSGKIVNSDYQTDGDLSRVTGQVNTNTGAKLYASAFAYTEEGAIKSLRFGNGKWETTQYNSRLQIKQIGLGNSESDTSLLKLEFGYGANNQNNTNLREQKISFAGLAQSIVQSYSYDELNRLKTSTETNQGSSTVIWQEAFSFDRYGNRSFDELNTTTINRTCTPTNQNPNGVCNRNVVNPTIDTATNRFADGQVYEYDAAGNLTKDADGRLFAYDAENHQTSFGTGGSSTNGGQYFYDGQGKRVKTSVPSQYGIIDTIFVYDTFGRLITESENTTPASNPTTKYLTKDHLGSTRVVTNAVGDVVSRHDYRSYGEEIFANVGSRTTNQKYSAIDDIRQQYTGYERDIESGLDYAQARFYNSKHGRFTSVDPLTASATVRNPQTFNRYSYAGNNPYKYTDPLGLIFYTGCSTIQQMCEDKEITRKNQDRETGQAESSAAAPPANNNQQTSDLPPHEAAHMAGQPGTIDVQFRANDVHSIETTAGTELYPDRIRNEVATQPVSPAQIVRQFVASVSFQVFDSDGNDITDFDYEVTYTAEGNGISSRVDTLGRVSSNDAGEGSVGTFVGSTQKMGTTTDTYKENTGPPSNTVFSGSGTLTIYTSDGRSAKIDFKISGTGNLVVTPSEKTTVELAQPKQK